jgi:hypothetical protein
MTRECSLSLNSIERAPLLTVEILYYDGGADRRPTSIAFPAIWRLGHGRSQETQCGLFLFSCDNLLLSGYPRAYEPLMDWES